jgi:type I restriction enzyme S subunit
MIPKGWETTKIGSITDLINGRGFKSTEWSNDGLPIIRIQNLNGSKEFNYTNVQVEKKHIINKGDLLFAWSGNRGTSFGPFLWNGVPGALNQHIFKLDNIKRFDTKFLFFALKQITQKIENNAHGASGLVHIKKSDFVEFEIPVPPLPEQKRIAEILTSVDDAIHATEKVIDQTKRVKQGLLQELLTRGIGHTKFKMTEIGEIPEGWDVVSIGDLCNVIDPQPDHRTPKEDLGGIPYVGMGDLAENGKINFDGCRHVIKSALNKQIDSFNIDDGAFIFGKIGTIGNPTRIPKDRFFALSANLVLITGKNQGNLDYLFFVLQSKLISSQISMLTNSTSQPALGIKKVRSFRCPLPSSSERTRFVEKLKFMDEILDSNQDDLRSLLKIKSGLMQDLLTGKVRVEG